MVIPKKLWEIVLNELNECHLGINRMKALARSDLNLTTSLKKCNSCQKNRNHRLPYILWNGLNDHGYDKKDEWRKYFKKISRNSCLRTTLQTTTGRTPAELLMKRRLISALDLIRSNVNREMQTTSSNTYKKQRG